MASAHQAAQPGFDPYSDTGGLLDDALNKARAVQASALAAQAKAKGLGPLAQARLQSALRKKQAAAVESLKNASVFSGAKNLSRDAKSAGETLGKGVDAVAKGAIALAEAPISITNKAIGMAIPGAEKLLNKAFSPVTFVGRTVVNAAAGVVKGALTTVTNPNIDNIVATAQSALKAFAPVGLVASGALGAMKAGLQGKSAAEIAWAAAEGASPIGIDAAVKAAHAIANGGNVLASAVSGAVGVASAGFVPGSNEMQGFNLGLETLKTAATKEALGQARKALPSEGARRAFDAAVGVVGSVALKGKVDVPDLVKQAVSAAEKEVPKAALAVAGKVLPHQVTDVLSTAMSIANGKINPATLAELAKHNLTPAAALELAKKHLPSNASALINKAQNGVTNEMRNMLFQRANGIPNIMVKNNLAKLSAVPSATKAVLDALKKNPALMASSRQLLAQAMRTNAATVNDALKIASTQKNLLPWRSMEPHTVAFIRRYVPNAPLTALRHAHTNVGGLDATGTVYIVEKGDGAWAVAQKLTGNGNRWKELLDYNKDKKPTVDKNIWVGEPLNLPPSWQKQVKSAPPLVALPSVPVPTIAPTLDPVTAVTQATTSIVPSILQAKAILAAWGKTDGINQSGITDYGLNPADFSTSMGPRDTMMLQSFQVWDNKTLNAGLPVNGTLDAQTLSELQNWASARSNAAAGSSQPATTSPGILPTVSADPIPQIIPTVIGGTDSSTKSPTPTVATKANPSTAGSGVAIGIGAVVGGLLFGLPGALVGAAGGAAIS